MNQTSKPNPTFLDHIEKLLLRLILGAVVVVVLVLGLVKWLQHTSLAASPTNTFPASPLASAGSNISDAAAPVTMIIEFGDGFQQRYRVPITNSMTVLDALVWAQSHTQHPLAFESSGSGELTLITGLAGIKNESGLKDLRGSASRCWQFWVDGQYAQASVGALRVHAGSKVIWAFAPYEADPKVPVVDWTPASTPNPPVKP